MEIIGLVLLILLIYWKVKGMYYSNLELKYQFEMFKLRDELRRHVIEGNLKDGFVFKYLDQSISRTVLNIGSLHILSILLISSKYKEDVRIIEFRKTLEEKINKNEYCLDVFNKYASLNFSYLRKKHFILNFLFFSGWWRLIKLPFNIVSVFIESLKSTIKRIPFTPGFSMVDKMAMN